MALRSWALAWLFAMALVLAGPIAHGQAAVLQRGYDAGVTGANLTETTLNTSNISSSTFGLVFNLPVDDVLFAQPLYVPNITVNGAKHNVLYVATMSDTLYAFDADAGGTALWTVNLASLVGATAVPVGQFVFSGDKGIVGNLGVLSTPVIDAATNTIYVVACTLENGTMVYRLHAIDITTGVPHMGSGVRLSATFNGVSFDAPFLLQRAGLVLSGSNIVIAFAAMELEYSGGYEGWVLSYNKGSLAQTGAFATATTGTLGSGVWQSGRPPAVDGSGFVYVFTGNSYGGGYDGVHNFAESVLKLDPSQGLKLIDWFTAGDWSYLDSNDLDLASSGPMLIPGTSLLTGGGKEGSLYVLNTSNMGKFVADDSQIPQKVTAFGGLRGGPVYWPRSAANGGPLMFNWALKAPVKSFAFSGGTFATTPTTQGTLATTPYPGGILTLSANADTAGSGVLWATTVDSGSASDNPPVPSTLRAFNAANLSQELWNSKTNAARDDFGQYAKFVPPLVANGRVYQSTWNNKVAVYGLLSGGGGTPDFQISASPGSQSVTVGQSVSYTVNIGALNGFTSAVSLSASGAPAGVTTSFTPGIVTGTATATLQVTASANAPVGSYTLVVSGTSASLTHSANVSLSISSGQLPTVDAQAFTNGTTASKTVTVSGVTTGGPNELVLAFIATDYLSGTNTTVTGVTGGGLSWSLVQRTNVQSGSSEIWAAYAPTASSNMSVTATLSQSVASMMYVTSFSGVDTSGGAIGATGSTHSKKGAPSGSLVTTRPNSLVLAVGNDYDNALSRTPGTGQTVLHQYLSAQGDTYWVQQLNAPVALSGFTAIINDTAPAADQYNLSLVEVRAPPAVTYSISGVLSPASLAAGSTVVLSSCANATVTADASGNYTFTGVPNGSCVVTPSHSGVTFSPTSQTVPVNGASATGINFTATAIVSTGLALDANVSKDNSAASKTVTSPAFATTSVNELLLALVSTDYLSGANTTVTAMSGAGLTWTLVARANGRSGDSEIWRAFSPTALSGQTVAATLSQSVGASLTVLSFSGVDPTGTNGANAIGATAMISAGSGAPTASLLTTRNNSIVVGVGNDYDNAVAHTIGSGQKLVHQFLTPTGDTYWSQMTSAATPTAGTTVTINDTAPTGDQYNLAIAEVRTP